MAGLASEDCRNIGFNNHVRWGDRAFHVQTEVVGREELSVRSTVLEGGVVRMAIRLPLPTDLDDVAGARALVEAHHRDTVDKVARGEIG